MFFRAEVKEGAKSRVNNFYILSLWSQRKTKNSCACCYVCVFVKLEYVLKVSPTKPGGNFDLENRGKIELIQSAMYTI